MHGQTVAILALTGGVATLAYSGFLGLSLWARAGESADSKLSGAPTADARVYLEGRTRIATLAAAAMFLAVWALFDRLRLPYTALCFAAGAVFALLMGALVTRLAFVGRSQKQPFRAGAILGLALPGLILLILPVIYLIYTALGVDSYEMLKAAAGFGAGTALLGLFTRYGDAFARPLLRAFALGAAELAVMALLICYADQMPIAGLAQALALLSDGSLFAGLLFGGLLSCFCLALGVNALGRVTAMTSDDPERLLAFALRWMLLSGLGAVGLPVLCGLLLGASALIGVLIGVGFSALLLGIFSLAGRRRAPRPPQAPALPETPPARSAADGDLFDELFPPGKSVAPDAKVG